MNNIQSQNGYAEVNGIEMYYEIYGSGEPLVLIHGGGSTIGTSFGRIIPLLSQHRKIIGVELQAHGHTTDRSAALSFEQDADDVAMLLQKLDIAKADFFGFSNGGNTAMQIAIRHPQLVRKLIIASAFYKREGMYQGFWDGMAQAKFSDMPQVFKDAYAEINADPAALMNMFNRDVYRMQNFKDWSDEDLKSIAAPSLILIGDADVVLPEHAVAMWRLIRGSQLAIIPGGHGKYIGEITTLTENKWTQDFVCGLIEEFLNSSD